MRQRICSTALLLSVLVSATASAEETIVFFRHGEKPSGGYGQLTCQGLNRSLALPPVLLSKYSAPKWLYAPNPSYKIDDPAGSFYYVRPLATIEPVAIKLGLSVNTNYAYYDVAGIESVLVKSTKASDTLFVAWEHTYIQKIAQDLMNKYGGGYAVPAWSSTDYDSLDVVHLDYGTNGITARFEINHEGLNGQPTTCPF